MKSISSCSGPSESGLWSSSSSSTFRYSAYEGMRAGSPRRRGRARAATPGSTDGCAAGETAASTGDPGLQEQRKISVRPGRVLRGTLVVLGALACSSVTAGEGVSGRSLLFIGNSLTYVNDLPAMVAKVAEAADDSIRVAMVAGPNLAVIDHVNGATDAVAQIGRGTGASWCFSKGLLRRACAGTRWSSPRCVSRLTSAESTPGRRSSCRGHGGSTRSRWRRPACLRGWRPGPGVAGGWRRCSADRLARADRTAASAGDIPALASARRR